MLKIFIVFILCTICRQQQIIYPIGQAFSIIALGISIPHNFLYADHTRILNFLQTTYLILGFSDANQKQALSYSVVNFIPNIIQSNIEFLQQCGNRISFALILVGILIILFVIYKIQKIWKQGLKFIRIWLIIQALIDWCYLILSNLAIKYIIRKLYSISSINQVFTNDFLIVCITLLATLLYPCLLVMYSRKQIQKQDKVQQISNRQKYYQLIFYLRIICINLILNLSEMINQKIIYTIYPILITYQILYYQVYKFYNLVEKGIFFINEIFLLVLFSFAIFSDILLQTYAIYIIVAVFTLEFLFELYKFYRIVLFRKKQRVMVYPQKFQDYKQKPKTVNKQLDATELELNDVIKPIRNLPARRERKLRNILRGLSKLIK